MPEPVGLSAGDSKAPDSASADPGSADSAATDSHRYPRAKRILKTDEFSSVFHLRPMHRSPHFVLYARRSTLPQARLGIVVAKRFAPRAVTRNTIKRIAREIFRQSSRPAYDCVLRLSRPVNAKDDCATSSRLKARLRTELLELLGRPLGARPGGPMPR